MESHVIIVLSCLVASLGSPVAQDCPDVCTCKWKGGKQTVECVNASLTSIPTAIDHDTQVLDIAHNYLPLLTTDLFKKLRLPHLQKIYLSHCSIHTIEEHSFRGLTNLVDLDLSYNALSEVPTSAVENCKYLMKLALRANPIRTVRSNAFKGLNDLVHLELSECDIETIDEGAFVGLDKLEYLRLDTNRLQTLSPSRSLPKNLRDLTLHRNRWHCDCHLLELHDWLQNFTVPYLVEPKCHSPPRLLGEEIKTLDGQEFACIPEVSPTSVYLEVIEGKNMSLVCTIKAIPEARVVWKYKDTYVNNGSTLLSDIDMRHYYYIERDVGPGTSTDIDPTHKKSELFLAATSIDDNGTFSCIAENKAGIAKAEFTLHVVVPVPPKPPQDVVEERFRTEHLVALVVGVGFFLTIVLIVLSLLVLRCKRTREKRRRRSNSFGGSSSGGDSFNGEPRGVVGGHTSNMSNGGVQTKKTSSMLRSRNGECSSTETVDTQMTSSILGSLVGVSSSGQLKQTYRHHLEQGDPDLIHSLVAESPHEDEDEDDDDDDDEVETIFSSCNIGHNRGDDLRMALLEKSFQNASNKSEFFDPHGPKRSVSYGILKDSSVEVDSSLSPPEVSAQLSGSRHHQLSPPTPFADEISRTLPRPPSRTTSRAGNTVVTLVTTSTSTTTTLSSSSATLHRPLSLAVSDGAALIPSLDANKRKCKTLPRKCCRTIPPPPQYKGVHFAPGIDQESDCPPLPIPTEGLPTGPARGSGSMMVVVPTSSETIPITIRKGSHPSVPTLTHLAGTPTSSSSLTFTSSTIVKKPTAAVTPTSLTKPIPPPPPPKTSCLSVKQND